MPAPLAPREVSQELRAQLWRILRDELKECESYDSTGYGGSSVIEGKWQKILLDRFVSRLHRFVDEFEDKFATQEAAVKKIFKEGSYFEIFGFLQYVLRHGQCPYQFRNAIEWAFRRSRAAYTIIDNGKTIAPVSNEGEAKAVQKAFADLSKSEFGGALSHLRKAAELVTSGRDAESIRESIHAVVSVARQLDPEANSTLGPALRRLEKEGIVHPVLKQGFDKIYGYTNAEDQGIRHEVLDPSAGNVDSIDAQFMFGACASFVSYLISKARKAKIDIK